MQKNERTENRKSCWCLNVNICRTSWQIQVERVCTSESLIFRKKITQLKLSLAIFELFNDHNLDMLAFTNKPFKFIQLFSYFILMCNYSLQVSESLKIFIYYYFLFSLIRSLCTILKVNNVCWPSFVFTTWYLTLKNILITSRASTLKLYIFY